MKEERDVVVPPPEGPWGRAIPWIGVAWVALHLLIPLRYYLGDDRYDERFAWRMFSAVRVQECNVSAHETRDGREHDVPLMSILPAPWVALMERNRPAVIESFLRWRCGTREGVAAVRIVNRCRDASGDPLPDIERAITCASGEIESTGEVAESEPEEEPAEDPPAEKRRPTKRGGRRP
jgi:hypothetical protein